MATREAAVPDYTPERLESANSGYSILFHSTAAAMTKQEITTTFLYVGSGSLSTLRPILPKSHLPQKLTFDSAEYRT